MLRSISMAPLCLVAAFTFFSSSSFARNIHKHVAQTPVTDLMTYQQLMQLTPAQRVAYIQDVREVLVLLEQMEIKARHLSYQSAEASSLREKISTIARFLAALPEARAEQSGDASPESSYVFPVLRGSEGWGCAVSGGFQADQYTFDTSVGTCVRAGSRENSLKVVTTPTGPKATAIPRTCRSNETAVYVAGEAGEGLAQAASYCAPNTALNQMKRSRAMALQNPSSPAASVSAPFLNDRGLSFKSNTSEIALGNSDLGVRRGLESGDTSVAVARVDRYQEMEHPATQAPSVPPAQSQPAAPPPPAPEVPAQPPAEVANPALAPKVVKTEKIKGGPEEAAAVEDAKRFHKKEEAVVEKPAAPAIVANKECSPLQASDMNGVRGQWSKLKDKVACVNAGNFSGYSQVAEGKCEPVHKAQNYPDNLEYVTLMGSPMKNQSRGCGTYELCAPEVFCDSSANEKDPNAKVKVFCVPMNGKEDDYKNRAYTRLCSRAVGQKKCDPMSIKGPTQEAWKQMADAYKQNHDVFCAGTGEDNKNFRNFFCSECKAIQDRLAKWSKVTAALAPVAPASAPVTAPVTGAPATQPFQNYQLPNGSYDATKPPGTAQ